MLYCFDGKSPVVGKDSYVCESAKVIGDVIIGDQCYVGHGAIIRGDYGHIEIGNGTAVEEGVIIHSPPGGTQLIGKKVTLGHGAILHGNMIGDKAVIGMGAIVSLFSVIGENSIIGEGSVVRSNQNIEPNVVAAGNPIKIKRDVKPEDLELWDFGKQIYIDLAKKYLDIGMQEIKA